ncbi:hypothetical protein FC650_11085 [Vibrio natriegens]|uniref:hypothetical protein n=1 Tax=Vibrio natriegens TaxID=691 RepID=UPI0015949832|nr:hypothetical protein [Vibrio natriegens]NVC94176.1 hypothetical protein [Vibrio natriegens]
MAQTINITITESQPDTQTSAQAFVTDDGPPPTGGEVLAESHDELSAPAPSGYELNEAAAFDDAPAPGPEDFFHEETSDLSVAPQPDMVEMALSDARDEHVPMPDEFMDAELTSDVIPEPKEQPVAEKKKSTRAKK